MRRHFSRHGATVVLAVALAAAVAVPVVNATWQLTRSDPTRHAFDEDAYYSFQVARSIADGDGVTANGHDATNGFQPLWTFALAPAFLLPDRAALAAVALLSLALWLTGAHAFARLLEPLVPETRLRRREARLLFAFVFLATPWLRGLYWNGLETGLAVTLLLVLADRFVLDGKALERSDALFGLGLGVLVLARLDAGVLAAALLVARWWGRRAVWAPTRRGLLVPAAVAALVVAPWLAYNLALDGSPAPQSASATGPDGIYAADADDYRGELAVEAAEVVATWPVPLRPALEGWLLHAAVAAVVLFELALVGRARLRWRDGRGRAFTLLAGAAVATAGVYVALSAAPWFYVRYFVVLGVALLALAALAVWRLVDAAGALASRRRSHWPAPVVASALVVAATFAALADRDLLAVDRRAGYMADSIASIRSGPGLDRCRRIGMFESGRAGYALGARVVNLDGKVNLDALDAIRQRRLVAYLLAERLDVVYAHVAYLDRMDALGEPWDDHYDVVRDTVPSQRWLVRKESPCGARSAGDLLDYGAGPMRVGRGVRSR